MKNYLKLKRPWPTSHSEPQRTGQGPEGRIRSQYQAMRRSSLWHEHGVGHLWLSLARQWKRPVQEIKRIVRSRSTGT